MCSVATGTGLTMTEPKRVYFLINQVGTSHIQLTTQLTQLTQLTKISKQRVVIVNYNITGNINKEIVS